MLVALARKTAYENGLELTFPGLLEELSGIKEVALLYPAEKDKFRTHGSFNKMSPRQKKLAEIFDIGSILGQG